MNVVKYFVLSIVLMSSFLSGADCYGSNDHEEKISEINQHIETTRLLVWDLGHENPDVKKQYNSFVQHLRQSYINGEGMIYKDIFKILKAVEFAADKHQFQVRKDPNSTPYIIHPIGVAENLLVIGHVRDPNILIAALLHDTVEDTETSFEEIMDNFGITVHDYVVEVTDDKSLEKSERKRLQIEHAPHNSAGAAQVKLGDKLYNLRDLSKNSPLDWEKERIDQYFTWSKAVVDRLPWVNAPLKESVDQVISSHQNCENKEGVLTNCTMQ